MRATVDVIENQDDYYHWNFIAATIQKLHGAFLEQWVLGLCSLSLSLSL